MTKQVLFILLIVSMTSSQTYADGTFQSELVKKEMLPLSFSTPAVFTPELKKYFEYYDIGYETKRHYFGWFETSGYKIVSHVILPENPVGTALIIHGYFDHTGQIKPLIDLCLKLNYAVATIDLPGHGLSSGKRCAINDFSDYSEAIATFIKKFKTALPSPLNLIGHSTGCSAIYEFLNNTDTKGLNRVIFLAPLVRSNHWLASKVAFFIIRPFTDKIPRKFAKSSGNEAFLEFLKNDPLEGRYISTQWFNALFNWNKKVGGYKKLAIPLLILQGDNDSTVDWRFNVKFLEQKFSDSRVVYIKNSRHHLPNESSEFQTEVFNQIKSFLGKD